MQSPNELLALYEQKFNSSIFLQTPTNLYEPVRHILSIKGKRIRPLLLLMACDMLGGDVQDALNPSFAMELFHNFTLVHDDIMDNSDIRRGVPTVHKMFGLNAGILAGDVMLAYTNKYLIDVPVKFIPDVFQVFNKTAIEIFEGQQMDVDFENRNDVTEVEYLKMIEYKTSVLLACSLQIGAILASAEIETQKHLYSFGLNLGLSFQIKDDYLDAFGEAAKVGKRIGGDILQNKKTLLYITTLANANPEQKLEFSNLLNELNEDKKINGIKHLFEATQAKAQVMLKAELLYQNSLTALRKVNLADNKKAMLFALAEKINNREY